ncbi:MAG: homoserine kinase [Candidatus Omnitrophica bacterium]|nr:homoserine kinase [Candidatus Omnitrophota bacterium]
MAEKIHVRVPASIGNMGSGFDCAGLSLKVYNEFTVSKSGRTEISFSKACLSVSSGMVLDLFTDAFKAGLKHSGRKAFPAAIEIRDRIPFKRGLGSSATVVLAGVISGFLFGGRKISKTEILKLSLPFEGHIDNLAASLYGGFAIGGPAGSPIVASPAPERLRIIVFIPAEGLSTKSARDVLPKKVPFSDAVYNIAGYGMLCSSFFIKDLNLLKIGLCDKLHQPYRGKLIPHLEGFLTREISPHIIGACLSGAGPSVAFFADFRNIKEAVCAVKKAVTDEKLSGDVRIFSPGGRTEWKIIE